MELIKIFIIFAMGIVGISYPMKADVLTVSPILYSVHNLNISTMEKQCIKCGEVKPLNEFVKNRNECKLCNVEINIKRRRSKIGMISCIYDNQIRNSKDRGHNMPSYTRSELQDWVLSHPDFETLYQEWVDSDYDINKKPSIDRINDFKGYSFDNIQLMTWGRNRLKANIQQRKGESTCGKRNIPVIGENINTGETIEFCSIREAGRTLGINASRISDCCSKKTYQTKQGWIKRSLTAGGYKWKYKI